MKKAIKVGSQVSKTGAAGLLVNGVVMRVDPKNETAGVMWKIEGGLLSQSEKFANLVVVEKDEEKQRQ